MARTEPVQLESIEATRAASPIVQQMGPGRTLPRVQP